MDGVLVHGRNWSLGRNEKAASSLDSFSKPETTEAAKKIIKRAEDKKKGLFTPSRANDELTVALGNKEHTGQIRGKGKMVIWKEGWDEDKEKYKKRAKKNEDIDAKVQALVDEALAKRGFHPRPVQDEALGGNCQAACVPW